MPVQGDRLHEGDRGLLHVVLAPAAAEADGGAQRAQAAAQPALLPAVPLHLALPWLVGQRVGQEQTVTVGHVGGIDRDVGVHTQHGVLLLFRQAND